ncbi:MAG TPA: hypothetical protein VF731_14165 [Solirubrobacterales bacterium]
MPAPLPPLPDGFAVTVRSLHRVAERLVAPARKPDNEIALEPTPGGFGTPPFEWEGARHRVRVEGAELVHEAGQGERRAPLSSLTVAATVLDGLLPETSVRSLSRMERETANGTDDGALEVDPAAAAALAAWYVFGREVLDRLAATAAPADASSPPVLWPEHFDVAIELGEEAAGRRATYGFSPGDENHPEPYAYVAPWQPPAAGAPWNARGFTGAELGYAELLVAPDPVAAALDFLADRRDLLAGTT